VQNDIEACFLTESERPDRWDYQKQLLLGLLRLILANCTDRDLPVAIWCSDQPIWKRDHSSLSR